MSPRPLIPARGRQRLEHALSRRVETPEIKFAPIRNSLHFGLYALFQSGKYIVAVPAGTNVDVSGRDLGFPGHPSIR